MKTPMRTLLCAALAFATAALLPSCATSATGATKFVLPIAIGYKIPDTDLTVSLTPDATSKTGFKIGVTGSYKLLTETDYGWQLIGPKTGLTYEIHTKGDGAPYLAVIGSGTIGGVIINPTAPTPTTPATPVAPAVVPPAATPTVTTVTKTLT